MLCLEILTAQGGKWLQSKFHGFYGVLWRDWNGIVYAKMVNTHLALTISLSSSWAEGRMRRPGFSVCLRGVNTLQLLVTVQRNIAKPELQCSCCVMVTIWWAVSSAVVTSFSPSYPSNILNCGKYFLYDYLLRTPGFVGSQPTWNVLRELNY